MRAFVVFSLLVIALLAGCVDDTGSDALILDDAPAASGAVPVAPDPALFLGTVLNDHLNGDVGHFGHQDHGMHGGMENLERLGYNDLTDGLMVPASGFTELHVVGDLAVVASLTGPRGATLVDVSDPTDMQVLSHIYNGDDNWDARLSPDGRFLFLGCQGSGAFDCTTIRSDPRMPGVDPSGPGVTTPSATHGGTACAAIAPDPAGCTGGLAIYNVTDPTAPAYVGFAPIGGVHNAFVAEYDDGTLYAWNEKMNVLRFDPATHDLSWTITAAGGTHDIEIQKHPITGDMLLYTGSKHMSVWNVNDPFRPELISFVDPGAYEEDIPAMWHEQTPMPCLIDGRHITIGAGERGGGEPQAVGVVDTTDPTAPKYLGSWKVPDFDSLTGQMSYRFSLHNVAGNCDGQVAVGHYHAGVWVFDISTQERMVEPVTLAHYQPAEAPVVQAINPIATAPIGALVSADVPNVWTAQWSIDGGTLFIPDMTTGMYALKPTWDLLDEAPGDAGETPATEQA